MAGAAPQGRTHARRRPLDAALNLVPFIDLLSCCIAFLLITAAWTQLARLDLVHRGEGGDETAAPASARPTLTVSADGYFLESAGGLARAIPRRGDGAYDLDALRQALRSAKVALPDEKGLRLRSADTVPYRELIRAMDAALSAQFPEIDVGAS